MTRARLPLDAGLAARRRREAAAPALRTVLGALAVTLLLAACGKVGPVRAPGPAEEITYPRQYPSR